MRLIRQVLCWLSILAHHNAEHGGTPEGELVGVADVVQAHWRRYGRNFYTRYRGMLKMPVLTAAQLATTASSDDDYCF